MTKAKFLIPVLCGVFGVSCSKSTKYEYEKTFDTRIIFKDRAEGKDVFSLRNDYFDFDGESVEIFYKGEFVKDSVDKAVENYVQTGKLPEKHDLY